MINPTQFYLSFSLSQSAYVPYVTINTNSPSVS